MRLCIKEIEDASGQAIDLYPPVERVAVFLLDRRVMCERSQILNAITEAVKIVAQSSNKKIQQREFPIWLGQCPNGLDMHFWSVSLPGNISYLVHRIFYNVLSELNGYVECGTYFLRDVQGVPFIRYKNGKVICYDCSTRISLDDIQTETRQWVVEEKSTDTPYAPLPIINHKSPEIHNIDVWLANRKAFLKLLQEMKGPCGYIRLRKLIEKQFGIPVKEREEGAISYGTTALIFTESAPELRFKVNIQVNGRLHVKLKYIALAHEIAHYILHFPYLIVGHCLNILNVNGGNYSQKWIDLKCAYDHLNKKIELDADLLGTFFLLPPWMSPLSSISSVIDEDGKSPSPEELAWRFLQPLFPDSQNDIYSWVNFDEMRKRADTEIRATGGHVANEATSIYERMLNATLLREKDNKVRIEVEQAVGYLYHKLFELYR